MQYVYAFDHPHAEPPMTLKDLLGGKGANLAEMTTVLELPVPPGFTVSTDACRDYMHSGWPAGLDEEIAGQVAALEAKMGRKLGDANDPLLVSVRSGAKFSMPGMMDTVLNLGLNDISVVGLAKVTDNERFAYDSYRRFISMYGKIVLDIEGEGFDAELEKVKEAEGASTDADLSVDGLKTLCETYKTIVRDATGAEFPQDPTAQLRGAVEAVFKSWNGARAIAYRVREKISHELGTAVNVQTMVFGNRDDNSGTGVGFTRNAATGENKPYGDFLINAQGEDVVAGIRNTEDLDAMSNHFPQIHKDLLDIFVRLENHYHDMLDTEFTIEQGVLWMLQTRVGKRTGRAALKMAVDMTSGTPDGKGGEWSISHEEAVMRITEDHLDSVLHPQFASKGEVLAKGLGASPGAAVGQVYFTADDAEAAANSGEDVILVRSETSPEDVHGMMASKGVLTSRGGLVSHAAVVARGWGTPAVVGAEAIKFDGKTFSVGSTVVNEGDWLSIDGTTGEIMVGKLELAGSKPPAEFETILSWADEIRAGKMAVRANADNGEDASNARALGAEGIGLCRTEHMFLAPDRLPVVREMILAATPEKEAEALKRLGEVQQADFEEILDAMDGLPVTVRLLDPPLHEFLPPVEELKMKMAQTGSLTDEEQQMLDAAEDWAEHNPMIGTRGVRLGVIKPGLYAMQVKALMAAAAALRKAGKNPIVEIMIPLTVTREELALARSWVQDEVDAALDGLADQPAITIGTMVETPRAAIRGDELAEVADFFSFGTNDLTQLTFGFSRDDVESRMMPAYLEQGLLKRNPFDSIDQTGVGDLVRIGADRGRSTKPNLKLGVCGEHGGDPDSIQLFYDAGLNYVSCSPYRVPVARLAAAQAIVGQSDSQK
ncbi:MAG: pyruvate, phosphate dikinase [Ilumatobacter coccineus]|uniref:Pyruvate, phosphate dikinase n=1 Tax=Ilumatobacter coccineus TaxID=467094 RepID=A0A2G6K8N7_9ACTN|nr:MAG: pyruvate, phosphate dikinase [Ilumatobacter coccineus]